MELSTKTWNHVTVTRGVVTAITLILTLTASAIAQPPARSSRELPRELRVFTTHNADVIPRSDGWIEIRAVEGVRTPGGGTVFARPPVPESSKRFGAAVTGWKALFTPLELEKWVADARTTFVSYPPTPAQITVRRGSITRIMQEGGRLRWFGMRVTGGELGTELEWDQLVHYCARPIPQSRPILDLQDPFLAAIDSAIAIARASRATPLMDFFRRVAFESEVSCPAWPLDGNAYPSTPASLPVAHVPPQAVFDFTVGTDGRIDIASLRAFSFLPASLISSAKRTMREWQFIPASQGGEWIAQRVSRTVRFADARIRSDTTIRVPESPVALIVHGDGWIEVERAVAGDGLVTHTLYSAAEARAFANAIDSMIAVLSDVPRATPQELAAPQVPARVAIGRDTTSMIRVTWERAPATDTSRYRTALLMRNCSTGGVTYPSMKIAPMRDVFRRAAQLAETRGVAPHPDTTGLVEAHAAGCPAIAKDSLELQRVLKGIVRRYDVSQDITLSAVISREGRVERGSVEILGSSSRSLPAEIQRALDGVEFRPAAFNNVRLRQRVYFFVHGQTAVPAPSVLANRVCMPGWRGAVQANVLSPSQGIDRSDLTRIAADINNQFTSAIPAQTRMVWSSTVDWKGKALSTLLPERGTNVLRNPPIVFGSLAFRPRLWGGDVSLEIVLSAGCGINQAVSGQVATGT